MLKSVEKNKKYIFGMIIVGLFGLAGLLLVPVARYMIKVSNRHPKAFGWITTAVIAAIWIYYIYGFLFKQEWDLSFVPICICTVMVIGRVLNYKSR